MNGIIIYNEKTGEVAITTSKVGGDKWNKFIKDGYKPIANISAWNAVVSPYKQNIQQ